MIEDLITLGHNTLAFSPTYEPGIDAALARYVDLGKSGAGKSNVTAVKAETISRFVPFWQFDPLGNLYGMRSNAAGDGPGIPMVIFGGTHGDVRLGEAWRVVQIIVEERMSAIFDLSELEWKDQRAWAEAWCESILVRAKAAGIAAHVAFDEADRFAPNTIGYNAVKVFARTARNFGIGWTFSTQRPQILSPDVIESANVIVAMRMPSGLAQESVGKKIAGIVGKRETAKLIEDLPTLKRGECWFVPESDWLPDVESEPVRFLWRLRETFDSTKPRRIGEAIQEVSVQAAVDVERIKALLGPEVAEKKAADDANDDRLALSELREENERLINEVFELKQTMQSAAIAEAQNPGPAIDDATLERIDRELTDLAAVSRRLEAIATTLHEQLAAVRHPKSSDEYVQVRTTAERNGAPGDVLVFNGKTERTPARAPAGGSIEADLSSYERKILEALVRRLPAEWSAKTMIAALAGRSVKSSAFDASLRSLSGRNYIEVRDGRLRVTRAGIAASGMKPPQKPMTLNEAVVVWRQALGKTAGKMLEHLVDNPVTTKAAITVATGYSRTSSGFDAALRELRDNELVYIEGDVVRSRIKESIR